MSVAPSAPPSTTTVVPRHFASAGISVTIRQRIGDYAELCRPRIAVMTMVSVAVGFTLASPIVFHGTILVLATVGIVQLVAASSILNQYLERVTDARMTRTASRPIASGRIQALEAVSVSASLSIAGTAILWNAVNPATAVGTLLTLALYVCAYTPLKTRTPLCTTIGAIPGAMPPVLGWLAAGGPLGVEAVARGVRVVAGYGRSA